MFVDESTREMNDGILNHEKTEPSIIKIRSRFINICEIFQNDFNNIFIYQSNISNISGECFQNILKIFCAMWAAGTKRKGIYTFDPRSKEFYGL